MVVFCGADGVDMEKAIFFILMLDRFAKLLHDALTKGDKHDRKNNHFTA
jgi:hypothetical protein